MRRVDLALIAILLVALAVRAWGIDFGLPLSVCRPDENLVVQPALEYFGGDFDPRFYAYGTLGSYLLHGVMRAQQILAGEDIRSFLERAVVDPGHWHQVARWISATLGVVTVGLAYAIGSELRGRVAGLCSAFLLATCYLHARESHFGTLDVLATTFTTAAVLCALRAEASGRWSSLLAAAACVGFAAATKYGGALAAVAVLAAVLVTRGVPPRTAIAKLAAAALVAFAAFLVAMPYAAVHPAEVLAAVRTESGHLSQGVGLDLGNGWWRHASFTLQLGLGLPILVAACAGIGSLLGSTPRRALVLLAFPVLFFVIAGSGKTVFVRYMLPLAPLSCVLAGVAVAHFAEFLQRRHGRSMAWTAAVSALLLAVLPAARLLCFDALLAREDSRSVARTWILEHAAPGASVAQTNNFARVQLPAAESVRERGLAAWSDVVADRTDAARLVRMRVPPLQALQGPGYAQRRWSEAAGDFIGEAGAASGAPDFVIVSSSPLALFDPPAPPGLSRVLAEHYVLATKIEASGKGAIADDYDPLDQFYVPYRCSAGVVRPGPDLAIWLRK